MYEEEEEILWVAAFLTQLRGEMSFESIMLSPIDRGNRLLRYRILESLVI